MLMPDADSSQRLRPEALIAHLKHELATAKNQQAALQLKILDLRDAAYRIADSLGRLRHEASHQEADFKQHLHDLSVHQANRIAHIERLEAALVQVQKNNHEIRQLIREIELIRSSTTWKLGRLVLFPVRVMKRLRPKR